MDHEIVIPSPSSPVIPVWRLSMVVRTPIGTQFLDVVHVEMPVPLELLELPPERAKELEDYVIGHYLQGRESFYSEIRFERAKTYAVRVPRAEPSDDGESDDESDAAADPWEN